MIIEGVSVFLFSLFGLLISPYFYFCDSLYHLNHLIGRLYDRLINKPILNIHVDLIGGQEILEKNIPCVMVCNHQSSLDLVIMGSIVPKRTVVIVKKSIAYYPIFGWYNWVCRNIFVDRFNHSSAINSLDKAGKRMIRDKLVVFIFPEGTRSHTKSPDMLPFKKGAFHLARQTGVPIVPLVVSWYNSAYNRKDKIFPGGHIKIKALDPIVSNVENESIDDLIQKTRQKMLDELIEISK